MFQGRSLKAIRAPAWVILKRLVFQPVKSFPPVICDLQTSICDSHVIAVGLALARHEEAREVGAAGALLASPRGTGITGTALYVDKGFSRLGKAL